MSDVAVRPLGEDDWQDFRGIRLEALAESPDAFASGYAEEEAYDEDFWRLRLRRSARLVAGSEDGRLVGLINVGQARGEEGPVPEVAEIFGLWVRPEARGTGVATLLVEAGATQARSDGRSHIAYWVGTDNGRAVAFASGMGFRPTDYRRAMRSPSGEESGEQEIAMILPLGADRGTGFRL